MQPIPTHVASVPYYLKERSLIFRDLKYQYDFSFFTMTSAPILSRSHLLHIPLLVGSPMHFLQTSGFSVFLIRKFARKFLCSYRTSVNDWSIIFPRKRTGSYKRQQGTTFPSAMTLSIRLAQEKAFFKGRKSLIRWP